MNSGLNRDETPWSESQHYSQLMGAAKAASAFDATKPSGATGAEGLLAPERGPAPVCVSYRPDSFSAAP